MAIVKGTGAGDLLYGTKGNDQIYGYGGGDRLIGGTGTDDGEGNDSLYGGDGDDALSAGVGNDLIYGGAGNDEIDAEKGNDRIYAGSGDDRILYEFGDGSDRIDGGSDRYGDDLELDLGPSRYHPDPKGALGVVAFGGSDPGFVVNDATTSSVVHVRGVEYINVETAQNSDLVDLRALGGSDVKGVFAAAGAGNDRLLGSYEDESFSAGRGDDVVRANGGDDFVFVGVGHDRVQLGGGHDTLNVGYGGIDGVEYGFSPNESVRSEVADFRNDEDRLILDFVNAFSKEVEVKPDSNHNGYLDGGDRHVSVRNGDMTIDWGGFVDGKDDGEQVVILNDTTKIDMAFVDVHVGFGK